MRRVPLLPRRSLVFLQNPVDKIHRRSQRRPAAHWPFLRLRRGARQRFPNQPPVHAQFPRHPFDRPGSELVLPPDLLE
jgi:hypothetical protein